MNCLELSQVLTNYFDESMQILISEDEADSRFLYVGQVGMPLRENNLVLLIVASQGVESELKLDEGEELRFVPAK